MHCGLQRWKERLKKKIATESCLRKCFLSTTAYNGLEEMSAYFRVARAFLLPHYAKEWNQCWMYFLSCLRAGLRFSPVADFNKLIELRLRLCWPPTRRTSCRINRWGQWSGWGGWNWLRASINSVTMIRLIGPVATTSELITYSKLCQFCQSLKLMMSLCLVAQISYIALTPPNATSAQIVFFLLFCFDLPRGAPKIPFDSNLISIQRRWALFWFGLINTFHISRSLLTKHEIQQRGGGLFPPRAPVSSCCCSLDVASCWETSL